MAWQTWPQTAEAAGEPLEVAVAIGSTDSVPAALDLGLNPMRGWGRVRADGAWSVNERTALLAEAELRVREDGILNRASASMEVRAGLRRRIGGGAGERLQLTAVVGRSPLQSLGSPGLRAGLGLRWTGEHDVQTAPAGPPSRPLRLQIRGPDGQALVPEVSLDGQPVQTLVDADGSLQVPVPEGARTLSLQLSGHARLEEALAAPPDPDTPWRLERVLPLGGGDGVLVLDLRDPSGRPLPEVSVVLERADGTLPPVDLGEVCGGCALTYRGLPAGPHVLAFDAPGMSAGSAPIDIGPTAPEPVDATVFVSPPVGQLDIQVRDEAGQPIPDAVVRLVHPNGSTSVALDTAGRVQPVVAPGRWLVDVTAPGRTRQRHELVIEPFVPVTHPLTVDLLPRDELDATLHVEVVDADGRPVAGARIASGDQVLSTTSSGGKVSIDGLSPGELRLQIDHEDFRPEPTRVLALDAGEETGVSVVLGWMPGALVLRATDADGRPVDSTVRLEGAHKTILERTGPDGLLGRTLTAGDWRVQLIDHHHQPVGVDISVDEGRNTVLAVELVAHPATTGSDGADLTVRVVDETDQPVEGARVRLGDRLLGTTSTEGRLHTAGVSPGEVQVAVEGRYFDPWSDRLAVDSGDSEEVWANLRSRLGRVELVAVDPEGAPISAQVRVTGANGQTSLSRLGTDGRRHYRLAPGPWEFAFASERHGFGLEDLRVMREQEHYEVRWVGAPSPAATILPALPRRPVEVRLWSRPDEAPTAGTLRMLGPDVMAPVEVGLDGVWQGALRLGEWEALATAPALGIGGADLPLEAGETTAALTVELGEVAVELTPDEVSIDDTLYFALGSAELEPGARTSLEAVARTLRGNPQLRRVRVEGHADQSGSAELNQTLSEARAAAVRDALVGLEVAPHRLEVVGYGESRPVASDGAQNRRVVFRVVETREAVEVGVP